MGMGTRGGVELIVGAQPKLEIGINLPQVRIACLPSHPTYCRNQGLDRAARTSRKASVHDLIRIAIPRKLKPRFEIVVRLRPTVVVKDAEVAQRQGPNRPGEGFLHLARVLHAYEHEPPHARLCQWVWRECSKLMLNGLQRGHAAVATRVLMGCAESVPFDFEQRPT